MMTNNNDPTQINNYHDLLPPTTADMGYPATTYGNQDPTYTTCTPVTMSTDTMTTVDHHQRVQEPMDVSCRSQENRQSELPSGKNEMTYTTQLLITVSILLRTVIAALYFSLYYNVLL